MESDELEQKSDSKSSSTESENLPSAPPAETLSFLVPVSQVELTLSASSLLNLDQLTHSDPLCVLFLLDSSTSGEWIEFGRTESILNNLNPEWKTKFLIDYRFEERQLLTFMIYDKDCAKFSLDNHDFLGRLDTSLGEIVSAHNSKLTRSLKLPSLHANENSNSTLTIISEEIGDCKKFMNFKIQCARINTSFLGRKIKSSQKMFVNISKQLNDGSWILLHRTDRLPALNGSISFPPVSLRLASVCSKGNLERPVRFQFQCIEHGIRGKSTKLLGECTSNYIELTEKCVDNGKAVFPILDKRKKSDEPKETGELEISNFSIEPEKTFVDYLQDGLEINFAVAIDFTASNGEPTNHASLHYKHGKRDNPYVMTLKIVGEILEDYSPSKKFYAYGFGAKGYPVANRVNHKFSLNFKETNPVCTGIDGILGAYARALQRVKLYGPTCFAPIIREVTSLAKRSKVEDSNKYYVLLILTDGIVCDPETTMDALVQASNTPLSVIIIGIGDEDFTAMEKFDGDDKLLKSRSKTRAARDIVQFVELRKYVNFKSINPISNGSKVALARSVLAELPQQVVAWMNLQNGSEITPS